MVTSGDNPSNGEPTAETIAVTAAEKVEIQRRLTEALQKQLRTQTTYYRNVIEGKKEEIEILRRCRVYPLSVEDLERDGGIGEIYDRAHMKPDTVQCLLESDVTEYMRQMGDGKFVFGFDEEPLDLSTGRRGSSVLQQMKEGLGRTPDKYQTAGKFQGWFLAEEKDGPVHAWVTCTFPPKYEQLMGEKIQYDEDLCNTLEWGITGGTMTYTRGDAVDLMPIVRKFWRFDTVQGIKYAAHLLFADVVAEVRREYPQLEEILLYRLETLDFKYRKQGSQFEELPAGKLSAQNMRSTEFFRKRGCQNFAYDHNPIGFASTQIVNGLEIYCVPGWEWMRGNLQIVYRQSQEIKKAILG